MLSLSLQFIQELLFAPFVWALATTCFLIFRSLKNFTRTGPRIREEISSHFSSFTALALCRHCFWAFSIVFLIALSGALSYAAMTVYLPLENQKAGYFFAAGFALFGITAYQFCFQLLNIPSSLQASAQFRFSRLLALWKRLNPDVLNTIKKLSLWLFFTHLVFSILVANASEDIVKGAVITVFGSLYFSLYQLYFRDIETKVVKAPNSGGAEKKPLNILMLGSDTLRTDRLGHANYKRKLTPFIDSLVEEGVFFTNCYTPLARTAPALTTLFTGLWPHNHKIRSNYPDNNQLNLPIETIIQKLNSIGYKTAAVGDWAASDLSKINFGFQETQLPGDQWNLKNFILQGPAEIRLFLSLFTHNRFGKRFLPELYYLAGVPLTRQLGAEAKTLISKYACNDRPFFLNLFSATTHVPFGSNYPYYTLFADPAYKGESHFTMTKLATPEEIIKKQELGREAYDVDQIINLYDGCVRQFDDEVKGIINHLDACGLKENTLIIIYSDHGTDFFETGSWGQGNTLFGDDPSGRVPLIIVDPQKKRGHLVDQTVRTVDFVPTILDLLDIKTESILDGVSLLPLFSSPDKELNLYAFQETGLWLGKIPGMYRDHLHYPNLIELLDIHNKQSATLNIKQEFNHLIISAKDRSIRTDRWKLIYIPTIKGIIYELFDLRSDPDCKKDVSIANPAVLANLREKLDAWIYADPLMK